MSLSKPIAGGNSLPATTGVLRCPSFCKAPLIHPFDQRNPDFRNTAGVARKTHNIASVHPAFRGAPTNTSHLDKVARGLAGAAKEIAVSVASAYLERLGHV